MVVLAPFPVLLKGDQAPGVSKYFVIGTDTDGVGDDATVSNLIYLLSEKLRSDASKDAAVSEVVKEIRLYGTTLDESQPLASLVLEHPSATPRLVATTISIKRYGDAEFSVRTLTGETLYLPYIPSDTVERVKFRLQEHRGIPLDQQRLIFNGQQLEDEWVLCECGIVPSSTVHLVLRLRGGGGPMMFADVSKESLLVKQQFSEHAPVWRTCHKGLNIEGKCTTKTCKAFDNMVISPQGFREFNLMKSTYAMCPQCHSKIKPVTCGFYDCVWKFDGIQEGSNKLISSPWKPAFGDQYHRFDADEDHGSVAWTSLLIIVNPSGAAKKVGIVDEEREAVKKVDKEHGSEDKEGESWNDDMCSICWSEFGFVTEATTITTTACGHSFHGNCITQWSTWRLEGFIIRTDTDSVGDDATVGDLIRLLYKQLDRDESKDAVVYEVVKEIQLYGAKLGRSQLLASAVFEHPSTAPLVASRCRLNAMTFQIPYIPSDTVERVKFRIQEHEGKTPCRQRLTFDGLRLKDEQTLLECGVLSCSTVDLVLNLCGGGDPMMFANVANESLLVQRQFSEHAPDWRTCHKGLNIEGKSPNASCAAFGTMVISPVGFSVFNVVKSAYAFCPKCHSKVKPVTCGFYDCMRKFDGIQEGDKTLVSSLWKPAFGDHYHRFDADENRGSVAWTSLLIVAKPRGAAQKAGLVDEEQNDQKNRVEEQQDRERDEDDKAWSGDMCSICWSEFGFATETPSITTTACGHGFHANCIEAWSAWCKKSNTRPSCPLCRSGI